MKNVRVCPKCGNLVYFNSYFGAYICENCEWEDATYAKKRDAYCVLSSMQIDAAAYKEKAYYVADNQKINCFSYSRQHGR